MVIKSCFISNIPPSMQHAFVV